MSVTCPCQSCVQARGGELTEYERGKSAAYADCAAMLEAEAERIDNEAKSATSPNFGLWLRLINRAAYVRELATKIRTKGETP